MTTQISLSFELICLLNWLLKNEGLMLNTLVKSALEHGLAEELAKIEDGDHLQANEHLYDTVIDFLDYLEKTLIKNLETIQVDYSTKDAILPTLQKIETDSLDYKTVWLSMQQTKARIHKAQQKSGKLVGQCLGSGSDAARKNETENINTIKKPMEILFEQLLKNWKPNNKETMN